MKSLNIKITAVVSALILLLTLSGCSARQQDFSKLKGRKPEKIASHLNWYTPDRLNPAGRKKLASSGVYVNEDGTSLGESYQYWMEFYNFVMNQNAASLDVVLVSNGKPRVVYLDCDGKTVLAAWKDGGGKIREKTFTDLEDINQNRDGELQVDSVFSNGDKQAWTLMTQKLPELPEYQYDGNNPYLSTVCEYLKSLGSESFYTEKEMAMVPIPIILKVDDSNWNSIKIWGEFWILNYTQRGSILYNESGGEFPGVMVLTPTDAGYKVQSFRMTADGEDVDDSLKRICSGDNALYHQFKQVMGDVSEKTTAKQRKAYLRQYVRENNLKVTAFEDYGWDPISLQ